MDLKKMRAVEWVTKISDIIDKYNPVFRKNDQDVINIFFHFHPGMVKILI